MILCVVYKSVRNRLGSCSCFILISTELWEPNSPKPSLAELIHPQVSRNVAALHQSPIASSARSSDQHLEVARLYPMPEAFGLHDNCRLVAVED